MQMVKGMSSQLIKTVPPGLAMQNSEYAFASPMELTIEFIQIQVLSLEFM